MDDISEFWRRFRKPPVFDGKRILEIGCGRGELSIAMAQAGAASVVAIDIIPDHIDAAKSRMRSAYPELASRIDFTTRGLTEIERPPFDLVVSKDSFEHIIDVPAMLAQVRTRVAPTAELFLGFSPLYHSPYGDHDRRRTAFRHLGIAGRLIALIPWGHLFLESQILKRHAAIRSRPVESMHDLNLNKISIGEFRQYVRDAGFEPRYFAVNCGRNPLGWPFSILRRLPGLEKYCTYNVYCELIVA